MKLTSRDLFKLQWPLIGTLSLLIAAGLLAWWSQLNSQRSELERNATQTRANQIEQRLRQVRTEELELKERIELFQKLRNSGITGQERRLEWTELLRDIQHDMRLPGISYEFGVQIALEADSGSAYTYFSSPMRLQLRLLHEEDLLNFLERIEKEAKALVLVRRCKLFPASKDSEASPSIGQLSAECELQWITVRRSSETK